MRKLFSPQVHNAAWVTLKFLKELEVPVTPSTVVETLEQHPDYPSLFSISDCLERWKVQNVALSVEAAKLEEIAPPFIACSKANGGSFILVNNVNGVVDYLDFKGNPRTKTREEFAREFDNIVLVAATSDQSGEKDYSKKKRSEILNALRVPALITGSIVLIILRAVFSPNIFSSLLLVTKFFGAAVSALFLLHEIDQSNPIIKKVCFGSSADCSSVLNSKWSSLFGLVSWGEIGFFYFTGGFLTLLLANTASFWALASLSLLALPYTLFSVFYQWKVVGKWCALCLVTQGILLMEFAICYFAYTNAPGEWSWSWSELTPLLACFLLPIFFWTIAKPAYVNAHLGKEYKKDLKKIRQNKQIFNTLLAAQPKLTVPTENLGIELGYPNAQNTLIKICNPYCDACSKSHAAIDEMLDSGKDIKVQIIYRTVNDDHDKRRIVNYFLALKQASSENHLKKVLGEWYASGKKDYESFTSNYPVHQQMNDAATTQMNQWCREANVAYTPAFFLNGHKLPEGYTIYDIQNLL